MKIYLRSLPDKVCSFVERAPFFVLAFIVGLCYLPAFILPFSFHNDGGLISGIKGDFMRGFFECGHDFMIGRPFQALFLGLQTTLTRHIWDLSFTRFLGFILLTASAYIYFRFLVARCSLDKFWAKLIGLTILLLPVNIIFVIWAQDLSAGPLPFLFAVLAYQTADRAWDCFDRRRVFSLLLLALSSLFFISSLFFYPPVAMVVFAFSLIKVIFDRSSMAQLRTALFRDVLFWGALMVFFFFIVKTVVLPFGERFYSIRMNEGMYQFKLFSSVQGKIYLLKDIVVNSYAGIFTLLQAPWPLLLMCGAGIVFLIRKIYSAVPAQNLQKRLFSLLWLEKAIWMLAFLLLMNSPTLVAAGCFVIPGYRVLLPNGIIWSVMMFWLLRDCRDLMIFKKIAVVFFLVFLVIAALAMHDVVKVAHEEYLRIDHRVKRVNFASTRKILFLFDPSGSFPGAYRRNFEFSLFASAAEHVRFYVQKATPPSVPMPVVSAEFFGKMFYVTPQTAVVPLAAKDLSPEEISHLPGAVKILYFPDHGGTEVSVVSPRDNVSLISFVEQIQENQRIPYWLMFEKERAAIFQLEYETPRVIRSYSCAVERIQANDGEKDVDVSLLGSNDGSSWVELGERKLAGSALTTFRMSIYNVHEQPYRYYRIRFLKGSMKGKMLISAIEIVTLPSSL